VGVRPWVVGLGAIALTEAVLVRLGRTSGSRPDERAAALPGDDLVRRPQAVTDHAITIAAPPDRVWPWLVQMGWGRAGWYTARWVDRLLFPANGPSADSLLPQHQRLAVGDRVPDGPPDTECSFGVEQVEPDRVLVLRSTSHLPLTWRRDGRARVDWSWAFVLTPVDGGRTRFHVRSRWSTWPWWLTLAGRLAVVPADHVMARGMLRGVRRRVERDVTRARRAGAR
jgi:hypothetical protein